MQKLFLILIIHCSLLIPGTRDCFAQSITWEKVMYYNVFGGFYKAQQTRDSGYIAVGSNSIGNSKMYIAKFNRFGDTVWTKHFNLNINASYGAFWVEQTSDSGYIIGGSGPSSVAGLLKLDFLGNIQWYKTFSGGWQTWCVKQTADNGYILAIRADGPTDDIRIVKTDSLGNITWSKIFIDNNAEDYAYEIRPVGSYGYIIAGTKWLINDSANVYVIRLNNNGDTLWTKLIGGSGNDGSYSVDITSDNGFIIGGYSFSYSQNYDNQSYIVKTDSNGNIQWQRTYSGVYGEICYSIRKIPGKGYVFCGEYDSTLQYSAFIRIIDFSGNTLHEKFYRAGDEANRFSSVEFTYDKGFILSGWADFEIPGTKAYIVKTDSLGRVNPIGINIISNEIPIKDELFQNYPNPFNPNTKIKFHVSDFTFISLKVYNLLGEEIAVLVNEKLKPGIYETNFYSANLSSGVYFVVLLADGFKFTKKIVLIK